MGSLSLVRFLLLAVITYQITKRENLLSLITGSSSPECLHPVSTSTSVLPSTVQLLKHLLGMLNFPSVTFSFKTLNAFLDEMGSDERKVKILIVRWNVYAITRKMILAHTHILFYFIFWKSIDVIELEKCF